jgi:molecular chaperone IbpA
MAIAGFDQNQINISQEGNLLTVKGVMGNDKEEDKTEFLYRGIANRNFERKFELADTVKVIKADLKNGLLSIDLEREIPEHQKPRNIQINTDKLLSA